MPTVLVTGASRGIGAAAVHRLAGADWDVPADEVAGVIERALNDRRPRARYVVVRGPRLQVLTSRLLPTALMDALLRSASGVPRRA